MLENQPGLEIFQQEVADIEVEGGRARRVVTRMGLSFEARAVVLTVGTFLGGRIHVGLENHEGAGPATRPRTGSPHACVNCRCASVG